jgi:hypothetical protein
MVFCVRENADRDNAEKPPGCGGKAEAPTWAPAPLNATGESDVVSERPGRAVAKAGLAKPPFSYRAEVGNWSCLDLGEQAERQ